jgi:hypothetical protein
MQPRRWKAIVAALLVAPATAVGQSTFWDFVALNGAPAQPAAFGANALYNGAAGQIVANSFFGSVSFTAQLGPGTSPGYNPLVVFLHRPDAQTAGDGKGVGVCTQFGGPTDPAGPCDADREIGHNYNEQQRSGVEWLILDLNGLRPGSAFQSVTLASLQNRQTYYFQVCSDGAFLDCSTYAGAGNQTTTSIHTVNLPSADWNKRWARFGPGTNHVGGYVVHAITTSLPEPGTMGLLATGLVALAGAGLLRRRRIR